MLFSKIRITTVGVLCAFVSAASTLFWLSGQVGAAAVTYAESIEYSGPALEDMHLSGHQIELQFKHAGEGLLAKDGALKGFIVGDSADNFFPATASIQGKNTAIVTSPGSRPTVVRYGWNNVPDANLFNSEGLPASPFRTDVPCYWIT